MLVKGYLKELLSMPRELVFARDWDSEPLPRFVDGCLPAVPHADISPCTYSVLLKSKIKSK